MRRFLSILLILSLLLSAVPVFAENDVEDTSSEMEDEDIYGGIEESGYITLQRGDRDTDEATDVLRLQNKLSEYGYLDEIPDGVYGGNTETAIMSFQKNNGLEENGIADPQTQDLLFNGTEIVTAEKSMDSESTIYRVQKKLAQWGFYPGRLDGKAGEGTNKAIVDYKKYMNAYFRLHPTPVPEAEATPEPSGYGDAMLADDELLTDIEEEENTDEYSPDVDEMVLRYVDGEVEFEVYTRTINLGESNDEVKRVQNRLHYLNYLSVINGRMDSATERALLYFQKKNNLTLNGIADEATQRCLYSESAVPSEEYINAYKVVVNKDDQRVYVYQWNGTDYNTKIKTFICSTGMRGKETETPSGTYSAVGPSGTGEWYYFKKYECYAKWGFFIVGGIMFHSVVYSKGKSLNRTSVKKLGHRASHGCIRLEVENAKWIYQNCPEGTTVVITG